MLAMERRSLEDEGSLGSFMVSWETKHTVGTNVAASAENCNQDILLICFPLCINRRHPYSLKEGCGPEDLCFVLISFTSPCLSTVTLLERSSILFHFPSVSPPSLSNK